jgi:hypothetical protein
MSEESFVIFGVSSVPVSKIKSNKEELFNFIPQNIKLKECGYYGEYNDRSVH